MAIWKLTLVNTQIKNRWEKDIGQWLYMSGIGQSLVPLEHTTLPWGNSLYCQEPNGSLLIILLFHGRLHEDRGSPPGHVRSTGACSLLTASTFWFSPCFSPCSSSPTFCVRVQAERLLPILSRRKMHQALKLLLKLCN